MCLTERVYLCCAGEVGAASHISLLTDLFLTTFISLRYERECNWPNHHPDLSLSALKTIPITFICRFQEHLSN